MSSTPLAALSFPFSLAQVAVLFARLMLLISPPPSILITPAPPNPYSPSQSAEPDVDDDGYRAHWLSLPPPASPWRSPPIRSANRPPRKGLSRDQFNSLLDASRNNRVRVGLQEVSDLRKELAFKNESPKQLERRARFLSKVSDSSCIRTICIPRAEAGRVTTRSSISQGGFPSELALGTMGERPVDSVTVIINTPSNPSPQSDEQVECGELVAEKPLAASKLSLAVQNKQFPPFLDEIRARLEPGHVSSEKDHSISASQLKESLELVAWFYP